MGSRSHRSGGGKLVSARRWREEVRGGSNYLRLPEGVKMFIGKPGTFRLDFMSFVAGKGNPRAEPGELYFERTFFVHQGIGPNQDWHLCAAGTFKQPCPVCEHRAKLSADPDADEALIKSLARKERQLWIVKDLGNDPDCVLIWEVSYHLFGKQLKDKINNSDEEDGYDFFADPVQGLTMRLALQQSDKGKWTEVADIEFRTRRVQYDAEIVNEMPCLDDLLVATPYDKLKALFLQTEEAEKDDEDEEPRRRGVDRDESDEKPRKQAKGRPDVSVGDVVGFKGMRCEVVHVSGDGSSLVLEDENEVIHKAVGMDDLEELPKKLESWKMKPEEEDDWDEEDEKPKSKTGKQKVKPVEEEEDGWDDDEDEKPKGRDKPLKKASKPKKGGRTDDDWDNWD